MKLPELKSVVDILNEGRPLSNEVHTVQIPSNEPDFCFFLFCYLPLPPSSLHFPPSSPSLFLYLP